MCFLLTTSCLAWPHMIVYTYIYIYKYINCVFRSLISDVTCNFVSAVVVCPSWVLVVPYRMLTIFACYVLIFMFWMLFFILTTSLWCFVHGFYFRITDWTCCHGPHLHAMLRIISRDVSGLAADSPCGVWGRGCTTCLLHDSPLFGWYFKLRVGM